MQQQPPQEIPQEEVIIAKSPLEKFFKNPFLSDCTVQEPGSEEKIPAHKVILASGSTFFENHFLKQENADANIVVPKKVSSAVQTQTKSILLNVLKFIYSHQDPDDLLSLGLSPPDAFDYLSYFHALECSRGASIVSDYLTSQVLNSDNCTYILLDAIKLADQHLFNKSLDLLVHSFSHVLAQDNQRAQILNLPFEVFRDLISRDDLLIDDENQLIALLSSYITQRESLPPRPAVDPKPADTDSIPTKEPAPEPKLEEKPLEKPIEQAEVQPAPEEEKKEDAPPEGEAQPEPQPEEPKPEDPKPEEGQAVPEGEAKEETAPEGQPGDGQPVEEAKVEEPVKEEAPKVEEVKPVESAPVNYVDYEEAGKLRIAQYQLSLAEKEELVKLIRLIYLSHETLIKAANNPIFKDFKDLFLESLSAKLNNYEASNVDKYTINVNPRESFLAKSNAKPLPSGKPNSPHENSRVKSSRMPSNQISHLSGPQNQQPVQRDTPSKLQGSRIQKPVPQTQFNQQINIHNDFLRNDDDNLAQSIALTHVSPQKDFHGTQNKLVKSSYPEKQANVSPKQPADKLYTSKYKSAEKSPVKQSSIQFNKKDSLIFEYDQDFDENGALFYLGSQGKATNWQNPHLIGQVKVFYSSLGKGGLEDFVGRQCVNCRTLNEPGSYMGVDLGANRYIVPTSYTIRNRSSSHHVMINWVLEASINGKEWFWVDKRVHLGEDEEMNQVFAQQREELKQKGFTSTWGIDSNQIHKIQRHCEEVQKSSFKGFRFFKIIQISKNTSGSHNLGLSGFELYGTATGDGWFFKY